MEKGQSPTIGLLHAKTTRWGGVRSKGVEGRRETETKTDRCVGVHMCGRARAHPPTLIHPVLTAYTKTKSKGIRDLNSEMKLLFLVDNMDTGFPTEFLGVTPKA